MVTFLSTQFLTTNPNVSLIPTDLGPKCALCSATTNLQRCAKCKVQLYCSRDHQVTDRDAHKAACNVIAKKRTAMETEEQRLRDHPGDFMTTANPMENAVGRFWGILETRTYMRARLAVVEALQRIKTKSSLEAQRDHMRDMLWLSRSDNIGVRYLIPSVLLRLGEDQARYDFVMWYETSGAATDYDWGNMDLPFLDVKNADVFGNIDVFRSEYADLDFLVAVTLLKIRLLLDLRDLQTAINSDTDRSMLSLRSTIISANPDITARQNHANTITKLEDQTEELYGLVEYANEFFWPAMRAPERHMRRPTACSRGSREEMQTAVVYAYEAWADTPGALEYVRQMEG